jgi:hypothetical protein
VKPLPDSGECKSNFDVSHPGNANPEKEDCPTGGIEPTASLVSIHEHRHSVKVGSTVKATAPFSNL